MRQASSGSRGSIPLTMASMKLLPLSSGAEPWDPALTSCLTSPCRKSSSVVPSAFMSAIYGEAVAIVAGHVEAVWIVVAEMQDDRNQA